MIRPLSIAGLILLLNACATGQKAGAPNPPRRATSTVVETPPGNRVLPFNGRIAGGVDKYRFVIVDFTNSRRPEIDQRLNVYRVGQKVGEIKISGPFRNLTVAADLIAGEARYGDEVKAD